MTKKRAVARQSLPEIIAADIRKRILDGELTEGELIRQEVLAEEYDVSRMPVREALRGLDAEGLVNFTTNRGATVSKHSVQEIGEMFDLRILLEVDLFQRSIPLMNEEHFARCEEILMSLEDAYQTGDVEKWGVLNTEFHAALYAAADRRLSSELVDRVNLQTDRYVRMQLVLSNRRTTAKKEHRELVELSRTGDIEAACALLVKHISRTKNQLLEMVAEKRSKGGVPDAEALASE